MKSDIKISLVIGSFNRLPFLKNTIDSVRADLVNTKHEIIIVDGGSTDGSMEWLIQQKDIITIIQHNRGEWMRKPIERQSWGYFMNLGFKAARGAYICMLSDDCLVIPGALVNGIKDFDRKRKADKKVGALAFWWRNWPEQENYWVGQAWGDRVFVNHGMYLREAMSAIGFCDEENYFFYHADGDLCLRLWDAGWKVLTADNSFIEHYSDANAAVRATNNVKYQKDADMYRARWGHLGEASKDWLYKEFTDTSNTARKYWGTKRVKSKINKKLPIRIFKI